MIRRTLRSLLSSKLSLAAALLAFSLGIGVNSAMYSVSDALLLRPLALANLSRLVVLEAYQKGVHEGIYRMSPADLVDLHSQMKTLEDLAFAEDWDVTITRDGEPEQVSGAHVSANWFSVTGAEFAAGRGFRAGEDAPGPQRIAVISEGLAQRRFGGGAALGRQIRLNGEEHQIVGLLKETSRYPTPALVYAPYPVRPSFAHKRSAFALLAIGLLRPGQSHAQVQSELNNAYLRIAQQFPETHDGRTLLAVPFQERVTGSNDTGPRYIRLLLYATGFVLLIACANVANLQLARISARSREFAIRRALGANRWRVVGQVLGESTLLALLGGALGCLLAVWILNLLKHTLPAEVWQYIPMWQSLSLNGPALAVTLAMGVVAGLLSGILPAWQSTKSDVQETLREGGRSMSASRGRQWWRASMVALQMTLALVLLIGAGLMVRGTQVLFARFADREPGKVATAQFVLSEKYLETHERLRFARQLEEKLPSLPGVTASGLVNWVPLSDTLIVAPVLVEGRPEPKASERLTVVDSIVSPGYFAVMHLRLLTGRLLSDQDGAEQDPVCVIDQRLAADVFPGASPLGHRVSPVHGEERRWCRVVGVVSSLLHDPWDREERRTLYRPVAQTAPRYLHAVARTDAPMSSVLPALKQAAFNIDPEQPIRRLASQEDLLEGSLAGLRMVVLMMGGLGIIALLLGAVGIFSVVSFIVNERTSEIGMRIAMGATQWDILRLVTRQTLWMLGAGMALGLTFGYMLAQAFSSLIWGVTSKDFLSLASVSVLLALTGVLATYLPARRAMRLDPMQALRND